MADVPAVTDIWGNRLRGLGPSPWTHSESAELTGNVGGTRPPASESPENSPHPQLSPKGEASGGGEGLDSIRTNKATSGKTRSGVQIVLELKQAEVSLGDTSPGLSPVVGSPIPLLGELRAWERTALAPPGSSQASLSVNFQPAPPALNSRGLLQTLCASLCSLFPAPSRLVRIDKKPVTRLEERRKG